MSSSRSIDAHTHDTIEDIDRNRWNSILEHSDYGSVFQSYDWVLAIENGLGFRGRHVVVENSGNVVGIFPNFVSDLRLPGAVERRLPERASGLLLELNSVVPGSGGPVVRGDEKTVLTQCFDTLHDGSNPRLLSHYIRCPNNQYVRYGEYLRSLGYTPQISRCRFKINLDCDFETIFEDMHKDRRYSIRKARELDSKIRIQEIDSFGDELSEFYTDYEKTMRRVDSEPYPPEFFQELVTTLSDSVLFLSAEVDGEVVGRHIYIVDDWRDNIYHKFSAVNEDNFQYYPSELIHEYMIKWGIEQEYDVYDFGPTPSDFEDGLFRYKEQYGGTPVPIMIWEKGTSPLWLPYKFARNRYKRLN